MEYGILVAIMHGRIDEESDIFQIIGAVSSVDEARELSANYLEHGPANNAIAPDEFAIHRRGTNGFYSVVETITL